MTGRNVRPRARGLHTRSSIAVKPRRAPQPQGAGLEHVSAIVGRVMAATRGQCRSTGHLTQRRSSAINWSRRRTQVGPPLICIEPMRPA